MAIQEAMSHLDTLSNNRWNTISTCHNFGLTWPNYNPKRTKILLQCNREDNSALLNALTGHCLLGRSCRQIDEEENNS